MFGEWKRIIDNKKFRLLRKDLSKAFDCLSPELILAKLHAYGFSFVALRLVHSYLTNRKQGTKVNSVYRSLKKVLFGGSSSFNTRTFIFCDMFFEMSYIGFPGYAGDNTLYVVTDSIGDLVRKL